MEGFSIGLVDLLDWVVSVMLPAFFAKIDSFMIAEGVSILGFAVAITILCVVIGAVLLRV